MASVAILLDNARAAVVAARTAGVAVERLYVSPDDYGEVAAIKDRERRTGLPLAIFGIPVEASVEVDSGAVRF